MRDFYSVYKLVIDALVASSASSSIQRMESGMYRSDLCLVKFAGLEYNYNCDGGRENEIKKRAGARFFGCFKRVIFLKEILSY